MDGERVAGAMLPMGEKCLVLGYETAAALIERVRLNGGLLLPVASEGLGRAVSSRRELEAIDLDGAGLSMTGLDLMLPPGRTPHRFAGTHGHKSGEMASGSLVMTPGYPSIVIASPELCLVQLAQVLSDVEWLRLACRWCGQFAVDQGCAFGLRACEPVTSAASILRYAGRNTRMRGAKKVLRLGKFVLDGARSPKEIELGLALSLPAELGGMGCLPPKLNVRIDMGGRGNALSGSKFLEIDLCWLEDNFGLEYIGKETHADRRGHDASRSLALNSVGIEVVDVTYRQLQSALAIEELAKLVGKKTSRYVREDWLAPLDDRQRLLNELGQTRTLATAAGPIVV